MSNESVTVVFSRRHHIGSVILRAFLWSAWSHCSIVDGDTILEASALHGVQRRTLKELLEEASEYCFVTIPVNDAEAVIQAAGDQVGKPYDWFGILGIGLRRKWEADDSWFCSEYLAYAFEKGGSPLFKVKPWRITPRDLYIPDWNRKTE